MTLNWVPNQGPQELFHKSGAFEVLYGGAAGSGKSESLLMESLRYVHVGGYSAILFRRTHPELSQARGLIERSRAIFPLFGGKYNEQRRVWRFPAGSTIAFSHMEHETDKYDHKSAEYAFIGFDELTSFLESQYLYLFSRARTSIIDPLTGEPIPVRVRSGTNPGDIGHEWVKRRWAAWLASDDELLALGQQRAALYEVKWVLRDEESDRDVFVPQGTENALSRQFIPARLTDNPKLLETDPTYYARLMALPLVERMQLLHGDWGISVKGNVFKAEWFKRVSPTHVPEGLRWVRFWDLALGTKTRNDFTASAAVAVTADADLYVRDMVKFKKEWPDAKKIIKQMILDEQHIKHIGIESAIHGLAAVQEFRNDPEVMHKRIEAVPVDADKLARANVWAPRAEAGKVYLVEGPWISSFLQTATLFDGSNSGAVHDDEIDAISGGVQMVANKWRRVKFLHL